MAATAKSRWGRFGLRTLFAMTTLLAVVAWLWTWLVWNADLVKQRRDAIANWPHTSEGPDVQEPIPWARRLMGDKEVKEILLGTWAVEEEYQRAKKLFPEAEVRRNDPFWYPSQWAP